MNKLRKRFKKETGEDYLIEVNKSESNTEFNWQYVKWLEEQIVSKNESLHLVSDCFYTLEEWGQGSPNRGIIGTYKTREEAEKDRKDTYWQHVKEHKFN